MEYPPAYATPFAVPLTQIVVGVGETAVPSNVVYTCFVGVFHAIVTTPGASGDAAATG